jgi:hypothetical protein
LGGNPDLGVKMSFSGINRQTLTLQPGQSRTFPGQTDGFNCHDATGPFQFQPAGGGWSDWVEGLEYAPPYQFDGFSVRNTGASAVTLTISFGDGRIRDNRLKLIDGIVPTEIQGTIGNRPTIPDKIGSGAPVVALNSAVTLLSAENLLRMEIVIVNMDENATIFVGGDPAALVGQGLPVGPGQSNDWDTSAALYARNDSGASVIVAVATVEYSS